MDEPLFFMSAGVLVFRLALVLKLALRSEWPQSLGPRNTGKLLLIGLAGLPPMLVMFIVASVKGDLGLDKKKIWVMVGFFVAFYLLVGSTAVIPYFLIAYAFWPDISLMTFVFSPVSLALFIIIPQFALLFALFTYIFQPRHWFSYLSAKGLGPGLLFGVLLLLLVTPVNLLFQFLLEPYVSGSGYSNLLDPGPMDPISAAMIVVIGITVPPLVEESFFRGYMFRYLSRRGNWIYAAVFTSIAFTIVHGDIMNAAGLFLASLGLCYIFRKKGLSASIGAHAGFNAISFLIALYLI